MKSDHPLYHFLEEQLCSSTVLNETIEEFAVRLSQLFLANLNHQGFHVTVATQKDVMDEIREEFIDMTRKKTYGFASLDEFRKAYYSSKI